MGSVHDEQRAPVHHRKAPRPHGLRKALSDLFLRHRKAAVLQGQNRLHRQSRVVNLPASEKAGLQVLHAPVGKALVLKAIVDILKLLSPDLPETRLLLPADFLQDPPDLWSLNRAHRQGARLDDAALHPGDLLDRIAQKAHMIHANLREYADQRRLYHIRRVRQTAHAALQHHDIAALFPEPQKGDRRLHLEGRRMRESILHHPLTGGLHLLRQPGESLSGNVFPVHLNALPVIENRRGNIPAHPVSRFLQNRGNIGQRGSLSIRPGNVHELQIILWISQTPDQLRHGGQPQHGAVPGCVVYKRPRLFICHLPRLFLLNLPFIIVYRRLDCKSKPQSLPLPCTPPYLPLTASKITKEPPFLAALREYIYSIRKKI